MPLANAQFTCKYVLHSLLEVLNFQCSYHKFVVHNQIHNIKKPSEALPSQVFQVVTKVVKGQWAGLRAHFVYRPDHKGILEAQRAQCFG